MNQTRKQLCRSCAAANGHSSQLQLQLCALLLAAAAVAASAAAAAGKEKPKAAEAPKIDGVDSSSRADAKPGYTTYTNFSQVMQASDARYPAITRVSDPGPSGHPVYTGFFFYQCLQFDATGRYLLGMRVYFDYRDTQPADRADVGFIDLKDQYKWTKIGETTAWSWQQGARLQWRPASDEIVWNDRSDDGANFGCRVYDFHTAKRRTLPRPIYDLSPDGRMALTHDFDRHRSYLGQSAWPPRCSKLCLSKPKQQC